MLKSNAVSINKLKVSAEKVVNAEALLNDKYILVQKGKKNYFLLKAV
jgi:tyrosyl-tRNA synthetase